MWQQFSEDGQQAMLRAQQLAVEKRSPTVEAAHLFLATLPAPGDHESTVATLLQVSGVTREEAEIYALAALETRVADDKTQPDLSKDAKRIIRLAFQIANHAHRGVIGPEHLFIACVSHQRGPHLGETLRPLGLDAARLKQHLASLHASKTPYKAGNPLNSLTEQSERAIEAAHAAMRASFCGQISTSHLLLGLLSDENFASVTMLQDIGADLEALKRRARESIAHDGHIATPQKKFSPGAKRALERAARGAKAASHGFIGTDDLLRALLPQRETWREKLKAGGQTFDSVEGLWTAEQVAALRLALKNEPSVIALRSLQLGLSRRTKQRWGIASFLASLLWVAVILEVTPTNIPSVTEHLIVAGIPIFVLSGVGSCAAIILDSAPQTRAAWMGVFIGWALGMGLGIHLNG